MQHNDWTKSICDTWLPQSTCWASRNLGTWASVQGWQYSIREKISLTLWLLGHLTKQVYNPPEWQCQTVCYYIWTFKSMALPLLPKVKSELERIEKSRVSWKPIEWCAAMVVLPKPDGRICICVDLTKLNENVQRKNTLYQLLNISLLS